MARDAGEPVRTVDIDPRSVAVVLAAFVGLIAVTGVVRSVPRTTACVAIAGLLTLAMNPLVEGVQRRTRLSRGASVSVVVAGVVVALAAVALLLVPPAVGQ